MRYWKAAAAALVMVLGAGQAQAVNWVQYVLQGDGIARQPASFDPTPFNVYVTVLFTVDTDITPAGMAGSFDYSSTGSTFFAQTLGVTARAEFTPTRLTGSYFNPNRGFEENWTATSGGRATGVLPGGLAFGGILFDAAITSTVVRSVAGFSRPAVGLTPTLPEPGTWALLLLGFGAIGASLRPRRPAAVSYAPVG